MYRIWFWALIDRESNVAAMQPGYGLLGYSDAAADMKSLLRFLAEAPEMFGDSDESGVLAWLDGLPLPDESIVDKYVHGGTATAFTVEVTGTSSDVDHFLELLRPLGVRDMVRSAPIALSRAGVEHESTAPEAALV